MSMRPIVTTAFESETATNFTAVMASNIRCQALLPLSLIATLTLLSFVFSNGCRSQSTVTPPPLPVMMLVSEYEASRTEARRKYDGHEIVVRGYTASSPAMPGNGADQGSVQLEEKDIKQARQVSCWFSRDQAEQFSKIKGGDYLTVKGVFNGEVGVELKFCKLVKIDSSSQ